MKEKVALAIERIKNFCPPEGYYLAFSGGKDSVCLYHLAKMAGVKFDMHYSVTTIDPPEVIYFMRENFKELIWDRPKEPFLQRMVYKGFPLRQARWCCEEYKEGGGNGRVCLLGVRWAESPRRKAKWKMVNHCFRTHKRTVLPIIDWTDKDVWDFIRKNNYPYCKLYDEGFKRLGCLFCPMQSNKSRLTSVRRYPRFAEAFRVAFRRLYAKKKSEGKKSVDRWRNGDEMFNWWITGENQDQLTLGEWGREK